MSFQVALQIPKAFHPAIIGHGGQTIQGLQSSHQVSVHVPARDSPSSCVLITGEQSNVLATKAEIEQLIGFSVSDTPLSNAQIQVSKRFYGALIGPGGSTLKQLEAETGCSISIPQRDSNSEMIEIQGTIAGILSLQNKISDIIKQPVQTVYHHQEQTAQPLAEHSATSTNEVAAGGGGRGMLSVRLLSHKEMYLRDSPQPG